MNAKNNIHVSLLDEVKSIPGGEKIELCIQCGTCSASCPHVNKMDHTPRQLLAMVKADMTREVLSSNAIWYCLSCYLCSVRCPSGIQQTKMMHILQNLAVNHNFISKKNRTAVMQKSFSDFVYSLGNVPESSFMFWYYWLINPVHALSMMPLALTMLKHNRLGIKAKRLKPESELQLKAILRKAELMGGL